MASFERFAAATRSIYNAQLITAAGEGNIALVKKLIEKQADVNYVDCDGNTPLHWAAENDKTEVLSFLLHQPHLVISKENKRYETALDVASEKGRSIIGKKISEAADLIIQDENRTQCRTKYNCDTYGQINSELGGETTLVKSTAEGDFHHKLSLEEIRGVIQMICPYVSFDQLHLVDKVDFVLTFNLYSEDTHILNLLCVNRKLLFLDHFDPNVDKSMTCTVFKRKWEGSDPSVVALLRVKRVHEWLQEKANNPKKFGDSIESVLAGIGDDMSLLKSGRILFANMLLERRRTLEKIEYCRSLLVNMSERNAFSYCNANILINFLETFALEDTHPEIRAIEKNDKQKSMLQKIKKTFFLRYYPKPEDTFIKHIKEVRKFLLHNSKRSIEKPEFLSCILPDGNVKKCFENLLRFTDQVHSNIATNAEGTTSNSGPFIAVPKSEEPQSVAEDIPEFIMKRFSRNVKKIVENNPCVEPHLSLIEGNPCDGVVSEEQKDMEELRFDFLVNIHPKLHNKDCAMKPKGLHELRNNIVHNMQKIKPEEIKEGLTFAIPQLYRYCLAKEIHKTMLHSKVDTKKKNIHKQFEGDLLKVNETFSDFELLLPEMQAKDSFGSYAYKVCEPLKEDWLNSDLIDQYLLCLAPLLDKSPLENLPEDGDDDVNIELSSVDTREIFRRFIDFMGVVEGTGYDELRKTRRSLLKCEITNKLCRNDSEAEHVIDVTFSPELKTELQDILKSLKALPLEEELKPHNVTAQDVVTLYKAYRDDKNVFSFENHEHLLKNYGLGENEKKIIEKRMKAFPHINELREICYDRCNINVDISSVVVNLLNVFDQIYKLYHLRIEKIERVFSDKTFIEYLLSNDVIPEEINDVNRINRIDHINRKIRNLKGLSYTAPYIVVLLEKCETSLIKRGHLLKCTRALLHRDLVCHLEAIVAKRDNRVTKAVSQILLTPDCALDEISLILTLLIKSSLLKDSFHVLTEEVQMRMNLLHDSSQSTEADRTILSTAFGKVAQVANDLTLDFIKKREFENANTILDNFASLESFLDEPHFVTVTAYRQLNKARLQNAIGRQKLREYFNDPDRNRQKEEQIKEGVRHCYKDALDALSNISDTCESQYFIALSRKAYTYQLMGEAFKERNFQRRINDYHEAYQSRIELTKRLWRFMSLDEGDPPPNEELFARAQNSRVYKALLNTNSECARYLNISEVQFSLLYSRSLYVEFENYSILNMQQKITDLQEILKNLDTLSSIPHFSMPVTLVLKAKARMHGMIAKLQDKLEKESESRYHRLKQVELLIIKYEEEKKLYGTCSKPSELTVKKLTYPGKILREFYDSKVQHNRIKRHASPQKSHIPAKKYKKSSTNINDVTK